MRHPSRSPRFVKGLIGILVVFLVVGSIRFILYSRPLYPLPLARDASQHLSFDKFYVEWWYFDGILNNDVHLALSFMIYAKGGSVDLTLFDLKKKEKKVYHFDLLPQDIRVSKKKCDVRMGHASVVENKGIYRLELNEKNVSLSLILEPRLKGYAVIEPTWLGHCFLSWIVPAPRAVIKGVVRYDGRVIEGQGEGYHDHNYFPGFGELPPTGNWFWGRFFSDHYTVILAQRLNKRGFFGDASCLFIYKDGVLVESAYGQNLILPHSFVLNKHTLPERIRFKFKQFSFIINNIDVSRREDFFVRFLNDFSISTTPGGPAETEKGQGASEFVFL